MPASLPLDRRRWRCTLRAGRSPDQTSGVEVVTSSGNSFIKHCVRLRESSKYRQEAGRVLVVGQTPIREILGERQPPPPHPPACLPAC